MDQHPQQHRWFRYYITTVCVLVAVVGSSMVIAANVGDTILALGLYLILIYYVSPFLITTTAIALIVRFRHQIRFSLRTCFVLVALIAVATAFTLNRQQRVSERQNAINDHNVEANVAVLRRETPWHLRLFGGRGYTTIRVHKPKPGQVARLKELFPEARVFPHPEFLD